MDTRKKPMVRTTYWITLLLLAVTGFGQMPIFKR